MTAAGELVARLRARGVALEPDGETLVVRPADAVRPEEVEALCQHKAEVLALLVPAPALALDPTTVREVLGADAVDPHAVGSVRLDVQAAVRRLEAEIATGKITPGVRLVRGRPLAEWLGMEQLATLMGAWDERTRGRP